MIRELDVDVPLRDVQEASYVGKGKAIMEEVSRRPRTRSMQCSSIQVPTGMFPPLFLGLSLCPSLFVSVSLSLHNECKHSLTQAANNAVNGPITVV